MNSTIKSNPSQTLLVICTGLVLVYFIFDLKWLLFVSFGLGLMGILSDWFSRKVEWVWFKLTYLLSMVVPNLLLALVFFLILTPIAFLAGIFKNKDSLQIKRPEKTAYLSINKKFHPADLENPW
ncbi:MAG: hypothetical protein ACK4SF_09825 [Algoriphagus aquaeductus]|uniref:hypothetical protein n=1 Tax=Algoriphagus aquaeductus TaxID=475299 RepID=UPI00391B6C84